MTDVRKVLIVDDSATVREDLRGVLGAAGFDTTLCETLAVAKRALARGGYHLLILDVLLPDGDGVEWLQELRKSERTARLPVMLLSSEATMSRRLRGLDSGADEYVGKPYDPAYVVQRAHELTREGGDSSEPQQGSASRGKRLLVVDDSPTFRQVISGELRKDGHETVLAESGEAALPLLEAEEVDGALVDLVMPGMSGIDLVRAIRAHPNPAKARIPVLMLTARSESSSMAEALAAGADAFTLKVEDMRLLRAHVRYVLWRRGEEAKAPPPSSGAKPSEEGDPSASILFDEVVARSGLSWVIGPTTIARVCRRAGVEPRTLAPGDLKRLIPVLRETLRVFLSEEETAQRVASIEALGKDAAAARRAG
jgi:DNA-binding response OmpR family regulator